MSANNPIVSVILPVYNGEIHLAECIDSILFQSYKDFEFIIVDDASTDGTKTMLQKYSKQDTRIKVITHDINQKQTAAANTAIKNARGSLLARMDADDIALPNRLFKQVEFMKNNLKVGMVGSWVDIIDDDGNILKKWRTLKTNGMLGWNLLFGSSFAHSSVMMRTDIVNEVGCYQSPEAEDYDLWSRISKVSDVANIPLVLQQKRVWAGQLALKVPQETRDCVIKIMQKNINYLLDNQNLPLDFIRSIRAVSDKNPAIRDNHTISKVRNTYLNMFKIYSLNVKLSENEKKYISQDLYQKLNQIFKWQYSINYLKGFFQKIYLFIRFPKYSMYNLIYRKS